MKKIIDLQSYLTRLRGLMLTLIILCSIGIGNVWGADETLTITGASSGHNAPWTTSYGSNTGSSKTSASNNIGLSWTNVARMNTGIQIKGSENNNFYSTSYPSTNNIIKSIKITMKTNTSILYGSTDGSNWKEITYTSGTDKDVSAKKYKYFKVTATSKYCVLTSIIVTYTADSSCSNKVTISKGSETNGTFTLDKTGEQNACDALSVTVTPSPAEHYHVASVSATNPATTGTAGAAVDNGDGTWTITYSANAKGASTINVTFEENSKASITLSEAGATTTDATKYYVGDSYTLPSSTEASCGTKVLVGWSTETVPETDTKPASNFYEKGEIVTLEASQTFYAVFATASGGGSTPGSKTLVSKTSSKYYASGYITGSGSTSTATWTADAFKMVQNKNKSTNNISLDYNEIRAYKDHSLVFTPTSGTTITSIVVTANDNDYATALGGSSISNCTKVVSESTVTITPTDGTAAITLVQAAQSRLNTIVVNYTTGGGTTYSAYSTECGACGSNPTIGDASLSGAFSSSSVGVTVTGCAVGTNCSWTDYGFIWSTSKSTTSNLVLNADGTAPSGVTKVQVGTWGSANTFDGSITPVAAGTYYYRAYGKNGYASGSYQYSSSVSSVTARSVTFNLNGHGSAITTQIVKDGAKATDPGNPSENGWRFDGWYDNESFTGSAWNFSSNTVTGNITLYAKWTQVYTVTYNYNGGSGSCVAGGPYAEGETVTTCATANKAGSTLSKWVRSDNSDEITPGGTFTMPSSNVTLTAKWIDTEYNLTQTVGANTTEGYTAAKIKSGDTSPSGLDLTYTISATNKALPISVTISGGRASWTLGTDYTWTVSNNKHSATLHINPTIISSNMTVTVTEQARYTVVWDRPGDGNDETEYYAADDNSVTMKTGESDCGTKKFYCWTENPGSLSPTPTAASSGNISGNKTYTAVYGDRSGGEGFEKVTSIVDGATYYIATGLTSSDYGCGGQNGSNSYANAVSLSSATFNGSSVLTAFPSGVKAITVAVSGNYFSMYDGTSYLKYESSTSNELQYANSASYCWELTASNYYIKPKNYDRWLMRNNNRFACYSSAQDKSYAYLYKPAVSWSNFSTSCELYEIRIDTPDGGTVTTSPASETGAGQTVTVNVTPNSCKYLSALKYNDGSDHAISIASTPYTFTMPASDVTVTATFADKSVTSIAANTSAHRTLMQNTSFVGEQIRVTYNNGETEYLAWDDRSLTFSGYTMSTLGSQTVNVTYTGCGTTSTTYDITVVDGVPITFSDCGITTVNKYNPGATVPVETTDGEYGCSGWEFDGWSETQVAHGSINGYTKVHNFTASTAKTLYAVYVNTTNTYNCIDHIDSLKAGCCYAIMKYYSSGNEYVLKAQAGTDGNAGYLVAVNEDANLTYVSSNYTLTSSEEKYSWQLHGSAGNWILYNKNTNKYLDLSTTGNAEIESTISDRYTISQDAYDEHLFAIRSNTNTTYYLSYNSKYFKSYTSAQGQHILRRSMQFSSTPPCGPRSVTFHGNGGTVTAYGGGSSGGNLVVTEAARDAGINLPTASIDAEDCEGNAWNFFGWIDHPVDVTRVPILTTDMQNDGYNPQNPNPHYDIVTDNDEFWAVYANTGAPETKYGTISFTMNDFSSSYSSTENTTRKTVTSMGEYVFGYVNIGHAAQTGIQFQENTGELYNKTSLGKVNSISFTTFSSGDINKLKVYVGNEEKTTDHQLTAAEMQNVGSTWTYYPTENESYFYITNVGIGNGSYVCVSGISVDFGRGTTVYATTPVCSTISLSGDVYVTSRNGVGIMAVTPLEVEAHQLAANADVVITSNSSDVFFSKDRNANFAKGVANQPKNSVTVTANGSGELSATTIYVHYKPSSTGTGAASDVTVYANLSPANPNIKGEHTIHVRNLPEKFVIAAKVGGAYYALPADMNTATNPSGVVIEVDEMNMTAVAPNTCSYTIWPVKTTNTDNDRYALQDGNAYGERVRFAAVNNNDKALWANNAASGTTIKNWAYIKKLSDGSTGDIGEGTNSAYEWKITTTVVDGNWQYTLQTDQTNNQKYLRYWSAASGGPKWGTYASGEQNLYFLPVTEVEPFEMQVVEWYPTKVLVNTTSDLTGNTLTVRVNGSVDGDAAVTAKGSNLYEISNLDLAGNPTKLLRVNCGTNPITSCTKAIPVIISRSTQNVTAAPFTTLTKEVYNKADLVVRDNAVLTLNGTIEENTFSSVTIYPTAKISVPSDKKLTANSLTFFGGIDDIYNGSTYTVNKYGVPELSLKGKFGKTLSTINYDMRVDLSQMYALALPYDVDIAAITYWDGTAMTPGTDLYISAYDGQARVNRESRTWIYETDFAEKLGAAKLKAGVGYTISAELQSGFGDAYSIIRMPMQAGLTAEATEVAKTVAVVAYANNQGATVTDNHKGWNFVGNPYMTSISGNTAGGASDAKLVVGCLVPNTNVTPWDGSYMWKNDSYRYVTIPSDDGSENWQSKWTDVTLKPFKNFFIQVATSGDLSFALASRANAPARYMQAQDHEVEFEVLLSSAMSHDHTGLLLADKYTPAYEINADLEKMENAMSVYTLSSGYKLAYNALSPNDAKQPIPVGYIADNAGIYTFELDENSNVDEVEHVWLTDYELNRVTDLMDATYEFTTVAGRNETRFALAIELKAEETIPTNINELVMDRNADGAMKFIYNDKMYILNKGVIYDATGKRVNVINK